MKLVGQVTVAIIAGAFSFIVFGYSFTILWAWFIVPTFGLPELTIAEAIGIRMVAAFISPKIGKKDERPFSEVMSDAVAFSIVFPLLTLAVGWLVHLWI